jgi:hypothetical protein
MTDDREWGITVTYKKSPVDPEHLELGAGDAGTIVLDSTADSSTIVWSFIDVPNDRQPDLLYDPILGLPMHRRVGNTVDMRFGKLTGDLAKPWALEYKACLLNFVPGNRLHAPQQYIAVLSGSVVKVLRGTSVIDNLVILDGTKVTWDLEDLQATNLTFKFFEKPSGGKADTGPFDAIQLQSGKSHTWEGIPASVPPDTVYGHYKYTVTFDSPFMPLGLSSITIDPAIDYLPPPASYPIWWPHGPREESEQHRR